MHHVLEFKQSQRLKPYVQFSAWKIMEEEKSGDKDGKVLCRLMNNAVYSNTMENLRNGIDVKLPRKVKDYQATSQKNVWQWLSRIT